MNILDNVNINNENIIISKRGRRPKIDENILNSIDLIISRYNTSSLKFIKEKLFEVNNISLSISSIFNALVKLRIS